MSCKKDKTGIDLGYDYVPSNEGLSITYQVRDIFHDIALVPANDTSYYQIKIEYGESFLDDAGGAVVKIRRFIREDSQAAWEVKDVWYTKNTGKRIEIIEENRRLIDFVFAPGLDESWDANALNTLASKESKFLYVHEPFNVTKYSFDSTCTVGHQDFTSFVDYNKEYDVFAKGIGKVYSVLKELTIDNFDTLDIVKGIEIEYKMIDYSE
ncbi:MAG: hypothetical protein AB8B74_11280 [Crocinitomicaceae bacterium]